MAKKQTTSNVPATLSLLLMLFAYVFAACALPFTLIAGLGLLIAVPFGYFAYKEPALTSLLKARKPIPESLIRDRSLRIAACMVGMTSLLVLVWWSNSSGTHPQADASFRLFRNLVWVALIGAVLLMPQYLGKRKK